jgi:1,4-dihydroxy-2-naphthoyl-CoA hydrolase
VDRLGIEVTAFGDDYLCAKMPVDHRTCQPMGILHGGASVSLAETVGSLAATMAVDKDHYCVGLEINANHLRSEKNGYVHATATAIHIGRSTQVWNIKLSMIQISQFAPPD